MEDNECVSSSKIYVNTKTLETIFEHAIACDYMLLHMRRKKRMTNFLMKASPYDKHGITMVIQILLIMIFYTFMSVMSF